MDSRANERFHLHPAERLKVVAMLGGTVGAFSGFYDGVKTSALRYLTENGHRLPRNVGGWYFYHKKKNYVMIVSGLRHAAAQAARYSLTVTGFFGLEYFIDKYVRKGTIDLLTTTASSTMFFAGYGVHKQLSRVQTISYAGKGALLGLSVGFVQDMMIWVRGGRVWYLDRLGIKNPRFEPPDVLS